MDALFIGQTYIDVTLIADDMPEPVIDLFEVIKIKHDQGKDSSIPTNPLQFRLAISLHGATDEVRSKIMPVNRKYPLAELTAAAEYYRDRKGKMITLEYILIDGVNDALSEVEPLARLARRLAAKVNLIPWNPGQLPFRAPTPESIEEFRRILVEKDQLAFVRYSRGQDISAACGQLALSETPVAISSLPPGPQTISPLPA